MAPETAKSPQLDVRGSILVAAFLVATVSTMSLWTATPAVAADRFYEDLLYSGIQAADGGDAERAAKLLRLACFGLLEEPKVLGRCLVRLALVQAELDDDEAFRETFLRIAEVEQGFRGYSEARLGDIHRRSFEAQVSQRISADELRRLQAFRALARERVEAPLGAGSDDPARDAPTAPEVVPDQVLSALAQAREVQRSGGRDDFQRELDRLRRLAEEHPGLREVQHTAAAMAYRLRKWQESRDFFERGGAIGESEPALLFYYAVVLYETGDREQAAEVLRQCLPRLQRTSFIEDYAAKILGDG